MLEAIGLIVLFIATLWAMGRVRQWLDNMDFLWRDRD